MAMFLRDFHTFFDASRLKAEHRDYKIPNQPQNQKWEFLEPLAKHSSDEMAPGISHLEWQ
jgi:hypothetical protein